MFSPTMLTEAKLRLIDIKDVPKVTEIYLLSDFNTAVNERFRSTAKKGLDPALNRDVHCTYRGADEASM